jgi:glycosyltransferase involved in cell wall biosynthesis
MPEAGYYEVHLAEILARSGHQVRIFTSNRSNLRLKEENIYPPGLTADNKHNIEILRFKPRFRFGATIVSQGILPEIKKYKPEFVLAIGIAKLFPTPVLLGSKKRNFALYAFFGENSEYYSWHNFSLIIRHGIKFLTRSILKRPFYHLAIKNSDKVFLYTPETYDFLIKLICKTSVKKLQSKSVNTSLGFDSSVFYFDLNERNQIREEQGITNSEFVIITVTRYNKSKSLEFMVDKIIDFRKQGYLVRYWIIGFNNEHNLDNFREYIQIKNAAGFISCFPFMDYEALRKYQSAADIGMWCQVTISIQQCMGTGLPVMLEEKKSVSHLVNQGSTGLFFTRNNILDILLRAYQLFRPQIPEEYEVMRKEIEKKNIAHFSYGKLVQQIISC